MNGSTPAIAMGDGKPREFANTLREGDRVMHAADKRVGTVARDPGEKNRLTYVRFTGYERAKGIDVMDLRFIPPGSDTAESEPPIDGTPPPMVPDFGAGRLSPALEKVSGEGFVEQLKRKVKEGEAEIEEMNVRAREIRTENARLQRAIDALEGRP